MLPKAKRLGSNGIKSLSKGKSVFGTLISMRFIDAHDTKVAISTSKKVLQRAAHRNKLKRKLYRAVKNSNIIRSKPVWVIIIPKKPCIDAPEDDIVSEINQLSNKAGIR